MNDKKQTGIVAAVASDGKGLVRQDGLVTFIPFTATGDEILYKVTQEKKNFATGKLIDVVKSGSDRTIPICPYYGTCGGCQLQHIHYAAQINYKRQWIADALSRIGKFDGISVPQVIPSNDHWGYRRRVSLVLRKTEKNFHAGYIANDHTSLVLVEQCPIFVKKEETILEIIQDIAAQLQSNDDHDGKVVVLKSDQGFILHFHFRKMPENAMKVFGETQNMFCNIKGILATSPAKTFSFGVLETLCKIDGLSFSFNPQTFIQSHPEQSLNIYRAIMDVVKAKQPKLLLDLYCGIGITSGLSAKQAENVIGVELNPKSIEWAKANSKKNGIQNVSFLSADVEKILPELLRKVPNFIIVNPPREGLTPKVAKMLKDSRAETIVYVSCMPSTLARDLKILCESRYQISSVQGYDMFPQTVHVETLVVLQRQ